VYLRVTSSDTQNCRSAQALVKLPSPIHLGGVISVQLLNDTQTIWSSGQAVKARTKRSAGVRYRNPISADLRESYIACSGARGPHPIVSKSPGPAARKAVAPVAPDATAGRRTVLFGGDRLHLFLGV